MYKVITRLNPAQIGYELKKIRKSKGVTKAELARRIGKTQLTLEKIENGQIQDMSLQMFLDICIELNVNVIITDEKRDLQLSIGTIIQKLHNQGLELSAKPST